MRPATSGRRTRARRSGRHSRCRSQRTRRPHWRRTPCTGRRWWPRPWSVRPSHASDARSSTSATIDVHVSSGRRECLEVPRRRLEPGPVTTCDRPTQTHWPLGCEALSGQTPGEARGTQAAQRRTSLGRAGLARRSSCEHPCTRLASMDAHPHENLAASATAAVVGSIGTTPDSLGIERSTKPDWQPPSIAFPLVWTPLYGLIAFGTARMLDAEPDPATRQSSLGTRRHQPGRQCRLVLGILLRRVAACRAGHDRGPRWAQHGVAQ